MPSLFSSAVESKLNLIGLIWSGIMTISVICISFTFIYTQLTQAHYMNLAKIGGYDYSQTDDIYYIDEDGGENDGENGDKQSGDGDKDIYYYYYILSNTKSLPLFVSSIYTSALVGLISIYGSMFVIGFVGPTGKYIKPVFRADNNSKASLHYGMFLGILFVFASLCFLCSLIFSNVWVLDYMEGREKENMPPYVIETFAQMFCHLFLFLSFIYSAFAIIALSFRTSILEEETTTLISIESPLTRVPAHT